MMGLDELKNLVKSTPISQIIGHYIPLRREGSGYTGLCPFHQDTKPSLKVSDAKGLFRCFACDVGGNAITFVQKYNSLEFLDALKELARLLGVDFELFQRKNEEEKQRSKLGRRLLNGAEKLYRKLATTHYAKEFQQFATNRGLSEVVCSKFSLGITMGASPFAHYLKSIPHEVDGLQVLPLAQELGLLRESGEDSFHDRIMFPIWDQFGEMVGFTGRAMHDYQKAKYINSKESFLFNKRHVLYGAHLARNKIREQGSVILVEGHMDLIALHAHGFENSCAVMGLAFNDRSLQFLKSMAKDIYLGLDSDSAGFNAMKKINALCLEHGIFPRYIDFSPHKDPDEYLRHESSLALHRRIEEAPLFIDVQIERCLGEEIPEAVDRKLIILEEIFRLLTPLKENLLATEKAIMAAKRLGLRSSSEQIVEQYLKFLGRAKSSWTQQNVKEIPETHASEGLSNITSRDKVELPDSKDFVLEEELSQAHRVFIQEIVRHPECLHFPPLQEVLAEIPQGDLRRFVDWLTKLYYEIDEGEYISIVMDYLQRESFSLSLRQSVGSALFHANWGGTDPKKMERLVKDIKGRFAIEKLRIEKRDLKERHRTLVLEDERLVVLQQLNEVERKINRIKTMSS